MLAGAITGTLLIAPAHASIKAGASCSKTGLQKIVSGKKYICIKSGRRNIWNKGVKNVKPATTNINPVAVGDPIGAIGGLTIPTTPLSFIDIDNLDLDRVYKKSREEITQITDAGNADGIEINYFIGEGVEPFRTKIAKSDLGNAIQLWSSVFKPSNLSVIWYSSKDVSWAQNIYLEKTGFSNQGLNSSNCTALYCGNASATTGASNDKYIFEQGLEFIDQGLWNRSTAAHEYTHLAQASLAKGVWGRAPLWIIEGGAQFYGEALGYTSFDLSKSTRRGIHSQYARDSQNYVNILFPEETLKNLLAKGNPKIINTLMHSVEFPEDRTASVGLAYLLGSCATEVLVAAYGHEKVLDYYRAFASEKSFEVNFEKSFGITLENFYFKLAPYFAQISGELSN
ncbi:MAG: hypothetical protein F2814_02820 [Actinobacteria bacterium]|nr:hypothetical protein [Actinomycetota bacterium]